MIPSHCYSMCLVQTVISLNNNAIFLSSYLLVTYLIMEVFGTTPKNCVISSYFVCLWQSKGGILSKTVDYINELKLHNTRLVETIKDTERLTSDTELLRHQVEELRQENALLRAQLQQHGIELATGGPGPQV